MANNNIISTNGKSQVTELIDYNYFICPHSARRRSALSRELTKRQYALPKDAISLAEGMPNDAAFPIESMQIALKDGTAFQLDGTKLAAGLQYAPTPGYPPLVELLKSFTERIHQPPLWDQRDLLITNGSQDGISKALEMCIMDGDPVLVQDPLYMGVEIVLKPFRSPLLGIPQDEHGMRSDELAATLALYQERYDNGDPAVRMPKILYLNPTGSNPTGSTMSLERRRDVYRICCQYNILILEDDAYYFMNFQDEQPTSFLSLDIEGRVIRFDSFSKILSSGLRIGWTTAPKPLLRRIEVHIQAAHLHSSTLSQVITETLLQTWGFEKLMAHMHFVRDYYRARRDITLTAMQRHLTGLAEWNAPSGGMFVWIKVCGVADVYDMLMVRGIQKGVTFVPGHTCMADPTRACNYIRASYSKATPKQIDRAMRLLAELIREERVLHNKKIKVCNYSNGR